MLFDYGLIQTRQFISKANPKRESFQSQSEARMDSTFQLNVLHNIFPRMSSIGPKYTLISKSRFKSAASMCQTCVIGLSFGLRLLIGYRNFPSDRIFGKQPTALPKAWSHIFMSSKFPFVHLTFFPILPWIQFVLVTPCHLEDLVAPGRKIQQQ